MSVPRSREHSVLPADHDERVLVDRTLLSLAPPLWYICSVHTFQSKMKIKSKAMGLYCIFFLPPTGSSCDINK